ncbi:hypothetical protein BH23ACT9_BH23ACT9_39430 [soil metagenome]
MHLIAQHLIAQRTPGRRLMVLDDAETIARQARRRAVAHRRRREALQQVAAASLVVGIGAVTIGVSPLVVGSTLVVLTLVLAIAYQQVRGRQQVLRHRHSCAAPGAGIGTPRPKGAFSITRHRSGAPVWIRETAPDNRAA